MLALLGWQSFLARWYVRGQPGGNGTGPSPPRRCADAPMTTAVSQTSLLDVHDAESRHTADVVDVHAADLGAVDHRHAAVADVDGRVVLRLHGLVELPPGLGGLLRS